MEDIKNLQQTAGLSHPYFMLEDRYDVVVIGSGYGASIAASRFSRAGYSVCVLERGKEYLAKDFPDNVKNATMEMQVNAEEGLASHLPQNPLGLYNFHLNKDLNVLVGCGLGGTSLINANVAIKPDPRVFEDKVWPEALRSDKKGLEEAYSQANAMLRPKAYPVGKNGYPELPKVNALFKAGKALGAKTAYTDINVNFDVNGRNHVGVNQQPCNNCGDCCSGCRYHAKNTLDKNYLPDARNHGAHIFTQMHVDHVEKLSNKKWRVYFAHQPVKLSKEAEPLNFIDADVVVIGAGALGSTEVLAKSKAKGLAVSDRLGEAFSGNGDVLGFAYNADQEIRSIGYGKDSPAARKPVGACITGVVDLRDSNKPLDEGMIIEEGVIPGALGSLLPKIFSAASGVFGKQEDHNLWDETQEKFREVDSLTRGFKHGATNNTQTYLVMSHDGAKGKLRLKNGKITVEWPGYANLPGFKNVAANLEKTTKALGGIYIENPITQKIFGNSLVTVHPLGGCSMGDDRSKGVVDHRCEVFDASAGDSKATHKGLYVMDGSVMPRSFGVNPLYSICAVSERAAAIAIKERGKSTSYDFQKASIHIEEASPQGVTFTEVMRGFAALGAKDFDEGFNSGKKQGDSASLMFQLTITMDNMSKFISNVEHLGSITGHVVCPLLSNKPLSVSEGMFNLFIVPENDKTMRHMLYRMVLTSVDGKEYYFEGKKNVRHDETLSVQEIWTDTSTLYVTVKEGKNPTTGKVIAKGIQKILIPDFIHQLETVSATNLSEPLKALEAVGEFGKFFFQQLWQTYVVEAKHVA